jgi:hypothetical protein
MKDVVTERQFGAIVVLGLLLVVGSVWYLKGLAVAALILGVTLLWTAWSIA